MCALCLWTEVRGRTFKRGGLFIPALGYLGGNFAETEDNNIFGMVGFPKILCPQLRRAAEIAALRAFVICVCACGVLGIR